MTNQEKLKAVIKQAQSRGWMEGYYFFRYSSTYQKKKAFVFVSEGSRTDLPDSITISLNDILFGNDFCEKFFGDGACNYCADSCGFQQWDEKGKRHQKKMLSMSEYERIDFLYKHVEKEERECNKNGCPVDHDEIKKTQPVGVNEEKKCKCKETSCPIGCKRDHTHLYYSCGVCLFENQQPVELKEEPQKYPNITTYCEGKCTYCPCHTTEPHACEHGCVLDLKTQPKEIEQISTVTLDSVNGVTTFSLKSRNDILNKINELVDQTNANTKAISACAKDCKINRN